MEKTLNTVLQVNSIFESISGEAGFFQQGTWCTFIRLQGCNLRCSWCFGVRPGRKIPKITLSRKANKKITDIVVGDKLMTYNAKRQLVETEVQQVFKREVDTWLQIKIEGHLYFVTEGHLFFTTVGIKRADELQEGDTILHSTFQQKISFQKTLCNPMHTPKIT